MKLQFDANLHYQEQAVSAVVDRSDTPAEQFHCLQLQRPGHHVYR